MTPYFETQIKHVPTREYYETILLLTNHFLNGQDKVSVLEMGTGWGISGSAFLEAGVDSLLTIDSNLSAEYGQIAKSEILSHKKGAQTVEFLDERMEIACPKLIGSCRKFGIVYIDGGHDYDNVRRDLFHAGDLVNPGGLIIMDDYLHSKNIDPGKDNDWYGVQRAVREFLLKSGYVAAIFPTKVNGFLVIDTNVKNVAVFV